MGCGWFRCTARRCLRRQRAADARVAEHELLHQRELAQRGAEGAAHRRLVELEVLEPRQLSGDEGGVEDGEEGVDAEGRCVGWKGAEGE